LSRQIRFRARNQGIFVRLNSGLSRRGPGGFRFLGGSVMFKGQSIRILAASVIASALVGSAIADMVYDDENTMSAAPTKVEVKNVINGSRLDASGYC
jgi:hypothetical protein